MGKSDHQLDLTLTQIEMNLAQIKRDYPDSTNAPNSWVRDYVHKHLTDESKRLAALENHELITDYDDTSILADAVGDMKRTDLMIGLTHWYYDYLWWKSDDATRFFGRNRDAIKAAVKLNPDAVRTPPSKKRAMITRIFVHEFPHLTVKEDYLKELLKDFFKIMRDHDKAGVDVRVLAAKALSHKERDRLRSRCVIKGKLSYQVEFDQTKRFPIRNHFYFPGADDHLSEAWEQLKELEKESVPLAEVDLQD